MKFTNQELEDLKIFEEHIENIRSSSFYKYLINNSKITFNIGYTENKGVEINESWPNEEAIKAFIIDFSQIYLSDKQPANFSHIYNILFKRIDDQELKNKLIKCREAYNKALNQSPFPLKLEDKVVKPMKILDHWLMGVYRHDNKEFRKYIKLWENNAGGIYKFAFIHTLIGLLNPILFVGSIVKVVFKYNK